MSDRLAALDDDDAFDDYLPRNLQVKSSVHFTPIAIGRHVAPLLAPKPGMAVLDVGAGPGKFCLAAAAQVPGARFVGVEFRGHLVEIARNLARRLQLPNAEFVHANAFDLDWSGYDAFYLYNPFAEQLYGNALRLDQAIDLDPANYVTYVSAVRRRLAAARLGTRVATYHGFGGPAPEGYELARDDSMGSDRIELWIKTQPRPAPRAMRPASSPAAAPEVA
jgi:SAM-dependent methyltransferase